MLRPAEQFVVYGLNRVAQLLAAIEQHEPLRLLLLSDLVIPFGIEQRVGFAKQCVFRRERTGQLRFDELNLIQGSPHSAVIFV